ncbi:beta-ketoacyl synthase N-terminal-like domain-containing protein [uncultured Aquimarina sp.]|uniref:beta-ketoacyl synthase N-terminal-like domain-containing protein n=1 Tax=uncultured Aquimarina sp. TaxID=575652 RepID=UPI002607B232|nr:beta-ketoacyl synthase N-terminal-like domain-containing protein [uncultured Aquimarina sp.]
MILPVTQNNVLVTGMGACTPIGVGLNEFSQSLMNGSTNFSTTEFKEHDKEFIYPIAELENFNFKKSVNEFILDDPIVDKIKYLRNVSKSIGSGLFCAIEAWYDSELNRSDVDLDKVAIVSSGTNIQQAYHQEVRKKYQDKVHFINPNYGFNFFDTDVIGVLSELLEVNGEGHVVGASSASGNMSIIQGVRLIRNNEYDVVIVVAPVMDLSIYEFQGFTALGAMARVDKLSPNEICRPFDSLRKGFVYGQSAACLILESEKHATARRKKAHGVIAGYGVNLDGNRNPNPSSEGEKKAMIKAMKSANVSPSDIRYINTHGTASISGDTAEIEALIGSGLSGIKANSTKSLIGHSLSASGVIETVATLLQMQQGYLHPCHNLSNPITDKIQWVLNSKQSLMHSYAINNNFGFGGINTSIVIKK